MTLTRAITQLDLEPYFLEVESFMEDFQKHSVGPFSAKVNLRDGIIHLGGIGDGWRVPHDPNSDWYTLNQNGGHPV